MAGGNLPDQAGRFVGVRANPTAAGVVIAGRLIGEVATTGGEVATTGIVPCGFADKN